MRCITFVLVTLLACRSTTNDSSTDDVASDATPSLPACHDVASEKRIVGAWMPRQIFTKQILKGSLREVQLDMGIHYNNFIKLAKKNCVNTVFLSVYSGGKTYWNSKAMLAASGGDKTTVSSENWADELRKDLSKHFHVAAWFEYGLAVGYEKHPLAVKHPDWLQKSPVTKGAKSKEHGGQVFLSPFHQEGMSFIGKLLNELVTAGWTHIHLDRIRYASDCSYGCVAKNNQPYVTSFGSELTGYKLADIGENKEDLHANVMAWIEFISQQGLEKAQAPQWKLVREQMLTARLRQWIRGMQKVGKNKVFFSMAPLGLTGPVKNLQPWPTWANLMHYMFPQVYISDPVQFQATLERFESTIMRPFKLDRSKVGPGIRVGKSVNLPKLINKLKERNYTHWSYWLDTAEELGRR